MLQKGIEDSEELDGMQTLGSVEEVHVNNPSSGQIKAGNCEALLQPTADSAGAAHRATAAIG